MGTIYSNVEGITTPEIGTDWDKYSEREEAYVTAVKKWAKNNNPLCKQAGEEISFPVADGRARYIVLSLKPVELVHLAVGDAWQFQYANRLTATDIRAEIKRRTALNKLFKVK